MSTTEANPANVADPAAAGLGGALFTRAVGGVIAAVRRHPRRAGAAVLLLLFIAAGLGLAGTYLWATYHFWAGKQALDQHKVEKARKHFNQALKVWPNSSETHFLAARAARRAAAYLEASDHLTRCQELDGGISGPLQFERILLRAAAGDLHSVENMLWKHARMNRSADPKEREMIWE